MEKIKQTGKFLTPTDKKCPQKHSTLLRLYIIYKAWSVSLKWREWKTDWIIQDCGWQKVSIKALHFAPCIYSILKAWSVLPDNTKRQ